MLNVTEQLEVAFLRSLSDEIERLPASDPRATYLRDQFREQKARLERLTKPSAFRR